MTDPLDVHQIRAFWHKRAALGDNRWTSQELLAYEHDLVASRVPSRNSILDLGSGYGALSRSLRLPNGTVLGVDWEAQYASGFTAAGEEFVTRDVLSYRDTRTFDLVLLFGVVTYLTLQQEESLYRNLFNLLALSGVCAIKNQCAMEGEFQVSGYSEELGENYVGRYPGIAEQRARLAAVFPDVETIVYDDRFNPWENSRHVAFFCRKNER